MKGQIMLTSVVKGKEYTCIDYILLSKDYILASEKAVGFVSVQSFTKSDVLSKFSPEDFLQVVDCTFKRSQDYKNPLNTRLVLETVTLKNGKTINLL